MQIIIQIFLVLILLALIAMRVLTTAEVQTKLYYALLRSWQARWPFRRGRGLPRVIRPFLKSFVPVWLEVEPQVKILCDPADLISRVILETGVWDEPTWLAIQGHLGEGLTFVDIGAHEGYCALKAARVVGASGRVIAIEANPQMVRALQGNVHASGATGVTVVPVACAESEATLDLFVASQSNTGCSSLSQTNASMGGPVRTKFQVPARPLDSILRELSLSRVDVVKIDVEGAELRVLKGALETLACYRPVLLLELDDRLLSPMGTTSADVTAFLSSCGYALRGTYDEANFEFCPDKAASTGASRSGSGEGLLRAKAR
jgi:FkbM family methyltransferase